MKLFYHDTHVHLDLYKNPINIMRQIEEDKSYTIAVTNLPILYDKAIKENPNNEYIRFALGFHPELVEKFQEQIPYFYKKIENCRYIGEIGLDFTGKNKLYKDLQIDVFKRTIKICNRIGGKVLSIHSRGASREVIEIIGSNFNGKVILHWFTGGTLELKEAVQNGYFFSINLEMLKTVKGKNLINSIPMDRILLESDGPFTKQFSDNYDISFIYNTIKKLSLIKSVSIEEMNKLLKKNFKNLLN
ncbi:MAG: TatD family hydrolase [Bacillaceae bacterium]|nr:TatD family hydrolase [Bacillaceae bacterium]